MSAGLLHRQLPDRPAAEILEALGLFHRHRHDLVPHLEFHRAPATSRAAPLQNLDRKATRLTNGELPARPVALPDPEPQRLFVGQRLVAQHHPFDPRVLRRQQHHTVGPLWIRHKLRVRRHRLGPHPLLPGVERGRQFLHLGGGVAGEVAAFRRVLLNIEQLAPTGLEEFDQLSRPAPNRRPRAGPLVAVMRIVPVEIADGGRLAFQPMPGQAHAVDPLGGRQAAQGGQGGNQVVAHHGGVVRLASRKLSGPDRQQRNADSPLVQKALALAVRGVGGRGSAGAFKGRQPAVVRGEQHQGVLRDPGRLKGLSNLAHPFIQALEHRPIDGVGLCAGSRGTFFRLPLRLQIGTGGQRRVRGVMRQVQKEPPLAVGVDELHRLGGQAIGQVLPIRCLLKARHEPFLVAKRRDVAQRRPGVIARDVRIKPLLQRSKPRASQVPFANVPGRVPGGVKAFGQRDLFQRQFLPELGAIEGLVGTVGATGQPVGQVQSGRMLARQQCRPGW